MQPLDFTYFGPLKTAYNRECDLYMTSNVGRRITQYEVVEIFTKAFNRISNIEKAANGFRAAGIWPLDTTKFDEHFLEASLPHVSNVERPADGPLYIMQKSNMQTAMTFETQAASVSNVQGAVTPEAQVTLTSKVQRAVTPKAQIVKPIAELDKSIPLHDIVNVPQLSQPIRKQTSRKRHSTIITDTPMKDALKEKEEKRKKIEQIKENERTVLSKNKTKKGVKNLESFEDDLTKKTKVNFCFSKNEDYYCLICDEKYIEPITEDWIICYKCRLWAHEKCTSGESTSKGFLCDFCVK